MELKTLHRRAVEHWAARVAAVTDDQWGDLTPCAEWSVRALVNHVVGEELWSAPLLRGKTVEEVGTQFDGDVLGDDPLERAQVDPKLVAEVGAWFAGREAVYRGAGVIGPRQSGGGNPLSDLLAGFGRASDWGPNHAALARFSVAFGSGDVDAIMARMTQDRVFESTGPAPDGQRHEGQSAVREAWEELFGNTVDPTFTDEETFISGDSAVVRWRFTWTNDDGSQGHVRGVDVLRFRDDLVAEKLSYVKG